MLPNREFRTYWKIISFLPSIAGVDAPQDVQSLLVPASAGQELGALVEELQQSSRGCAGQGYGQHQQPPGPEHDVEELDGVGEVEREYRVGEDWKMIEVEADLN